MGRISILVLVLAALISTSSAESRSARFEIINCGHNDSEFCWRLWSGSYIIANGESYESRAGAEQAIRNVREYAATAAGP